MTVAVSALYGAIACGGMAGTATRLSRLRESVWSIRTARTTGDRDDRRRGPSGVGHDAHRLLQQGRTGRALVTRVILVPPDASDDRSPDRRGACAAMRRHDPAVGVGVLGRGVAAGASVYNRRHADLPRPRRDDAAAARGPRRDAAVPDRVVRQPVSSAHAFGRAARAALDEAHERVAAAPRRRAARDRLHVGRHRGEQPRAEGRRLGRQGARPPDRDVVGRAPRRRPHAALPREVRLRDRRAAGRPLRPGRPGPARGGASPTGRSSSRSCSPTTRSARSSRSPRSPTRVRAHKGVLLARRRRPGARRTSTSTSRPSAPTCVSLGGAQVRGPEGRRRALRPPRDAHPRPAAGRRRRSAIAGPAPRTSPGPSGSRPRYELSCAERPGDRRRGCAACASGSRRPSWPSPGPS